MKTTTDHPPHPADDAPLDAVGVPIPDDRAIRQAFALRSEAAGWMRDLSALKSPPVKASESDLIVLRPQEYEHLIGQARTLIKHGIAYAVCPTCRGDKSCDPRVGCHGRGWVTEWEWKNTSELRKAQHLARAARRRTTA